MTHRTGGLRNSLLRLRVAGMVIVGVLLLSGVVRAGDITNEAGLAAVSDIEPSTGVAADKWYVLNAGNYSISALTAAGGQIDITGGGSTAQNLKVDNTGTALVVDNTGGNAPGLLYVKDFTLGAGSLTAKGGDGNFSYGINSFGIFTHSGSGSLTATGGSALGANGIISIGSFTHSGSGSLTATGGRSNSAHGIRVDDTFTHSGSGSLTATGGSAWTACGIFSDGIFTHSGSGSLTANGGSGTEAYGIYSISTFTHSGSGSLTATGGIGTDGYGISSNTFTHSGSGSLTATGGSAFNAYGINSSNSFTHSGTGSLTATGGSGLFAVGILSYGTFTHSGSGSLTATGGSANSAYGIVSYGTFTHSGTGSLTATGGSGLSAIGIVSSNFTFTHSGTGSLTATGGSAQNASGISSDGIFTHSGSGLVKAIGGSGDNAYGIYAGRSMNIDGPLRTSRQGAAASVSVGGSMVTPFDPNLSFGSAATLIPVVDLSNPDPDLASGLIQVSRFKDAVIASGALLQPEIHNSWAVASGQTHDALFLQIMPDGTGTIDGDFILNHEYSGFTMAYSLYKSADLKNYYLHTTRIMTPEQAVQAYYGGTNGINLFSALASADPTSALGTLYWDIDNTPLADFNSYVSQAQRGLTPHDATRQSANTLRQADLAVASLGNNISQLIYSPATISTASASSTSAMASLRDSNAPRNHFWLSPMYQQSMHIGSGGREFSDSKEKFGGAALGYARGWDKLALGGQLHYIRGRAEFIASTTDSDFYGVTLGGRFHSFTDPANSFKPFIDFSAGYAYGDYDMDRLDYSGMINTASPNANLYRAGLYLGSDYSFCDNRILLSPKSGAEYVHVDQSSYDESGWSPYLLHVDKNQFNSLRFRSGLDAQFQITNKLAATGMAYYKYECLDRNSNLHSQFLAAPSIAFDTEGSKRDRISGEVGAGLNYRASEKVSLSAGYNVYLEDRYLAHQINATLGISF